MLRFPSVSSKFVPENEIPNSCIRRSIPWISTVQFCIIKHVRIPVVDWKPQHKIDVNFIPISLGVDIVALGYIDSCVCVCGDMWRIVAVVVVVIDGITDMKSSCVGHKPDTCENGLKLFREQYRYFFTGQWIVTNDWLLLAKAHIRKQNDKSLLLNEAYEWKVGLPVFFVQVWELVISGP